MSAKGGQATISSGDAGIKNHWHTTIVKYQQLIIFGEVTIILLVGYFFAIAPKINTVIDSTSQDVSFWQDELDQAKTNHANAKKLADLYDTLGDKERDKLLKILPDNPQVPELMSQLESLFDSENIFMSDFLAAEVDFGEGANLPFNVVQLEISFTQPDDYNSYRRLLSKLEKNMRVLNIQRIDYSEDADTFTISAYAYFLKEK